MNKKNSINRPSVKNKNIIFFSKKKCKEKEGKTIRYACCIYIFFKNIIWKV
jgi:hypothetical protein